MKQAKESLEAQLIVLEQVFAVYPLVYPLDSPLGAAPSRISAEMQADLEFKTDDTLASYLMQAIRVWERLKILKPFYLDLLV